MTTLDPCHEANRQSWNEATKAHNRHKGDQAAFFREGGSTLFSDEIDLLDDVRGKSLLHLQCNAGQDTLSIATHLGANVTGVDISDEAINFARKLSQEASIPATFHRGDILNWMTHTQEQFDVVFVSYGAINWLSDLISWGQGIARCLKPDGRLVMIEFHPLMLIFEHDDSWTPKYDYFGGKHIVNPDGVGDYVGVEGGEQTSTGTTIKEHEHFANPHPSHEFCWGLSDIIQALLIAGLQLDEFHEYPYVNGWRPFPNMMEKADRRFYLPENMPRLPLMFGIIASKP